MASGKHGTTSISVPVFYLTIELELQAVLTAKAKVTYVIGSNPDAAMEAFITKVARAAVGGRAVIFTRIRLGTGIGSGPGVDAEDLEHLDAMIKRDAIINYIGSMNSARPGAATTKTFTNSVNFASRDAAEAFETTSLNLVNAMGMQKFGLLECRGTAPSTRGVVEWDPSKGIQYKLLELSFMADKVT